MITIKQVKKQQIIDLRHRVLREGKPIESAYFDGDDKIGTIHLAFFDDADTVVGCLTMMVTADMSLKQVPQYQLRGMAVDVAHRNQLVGTALQKMAEFTALNNGVECLWLNARKTAKDFYLKQGYTAIGEPFDIEGIGQHYKMVKYLEEHQCCSSHCADCASSKSCAQSKTNIDVKNLK